MKKLILTLTLVAGLTATAQVKVGKNPTTLATNANFQVQADNDSQFFINKLNGNAGNGTINPLARLHINRVGNAGTIATTGTTVTGTSTNFLTALTVGDNIILDGTLRTITAIASETSLTINNAFTPDLTAGTAYTSINSVFTNGNVGIGTTVPVAKLDLVGLRSPDIKVTNSTFKVGGGDVFIYMNTQDGSGPTNQFPGMIQVMRNSDSAPFPLLINPNGGNVGIGTYKTVAKLDVRNGLKTANNTLAYFATTEATNEQALYIQNETNKGVIIQAGEAGIGNNFLLLNRHGGNVGVGTNNPKQILEVINNMSITSTGGEQRLLMGNQDSLGVNNPSIIRAANGSIDFGNGDSWIGNGGTFATKMRIANGTGNVGIGTSAPTSKLQVVGLPTYADNAAAIAGGLTVGAVYHAGDGLMRVVF